MDLFTREQRLTMATEDIMDLFTRGNSVRPPYDLLSRAEITEILAPEIKRGYYSVVLIARALMDLVNAGKLRVVFGNGILAGQMALAV